jgi:hypothetical protein
MQAYTKPLYLPHREKKNKEKYGGGILAALVERGDKYGADPNDIKRTVVFCILFLFL